ncbi:aspartate 1-decarboxylase [Thermotomaculum hydrothermale]|uniref:Aspartate 1-decarboxylase n=1 Tax=Thermotomaculum hydrothermale TaxID=981385 RepID=A0A7R6PZ58_9BACT|nr:aspartate 1-decarboxylase [Thermotomaculum hydrothermale]BBB32338.1 aspartate 1-decarboxylase [Thermotomaculum hydrothermale]
MLREFLKAKIHRATITRANLDYSGSLTIDEEIMEVAGIREFEKIQVYNVNNGERLETYAIKGKRGSKAFELNGAAARKGMVGDKIIITTFCMLDEKEMEKHKPVLVIMDDNNEIKEVL